jgi:hypothetical protein
MARGESVAICLDGARILSPRILRYTLASFSAFANPFVSTLGWHLGTEPQPNTIAKGYCQAIEDDLLNSIDWHANGYSLFSISSLAFSCKDGWFSQITESNCFAISKREFVDLGGFCPAFQCPGGGLVNLDFFSLACQKLEAVILLGEGTFHQFHGGVTTNVPLADLPWPAFHEEYVRIRGKAYSPPVFTPHYLGHLPHEARSWLG